MRRILHQIVVDIDDSRAKAETVCDRLTDGIAKQYPKLKWEKEPKKRSRKNRKFPVLLDRYYDFLILSYISPQFHRYDIVA